MKNIKLYFFSFILSLVISLILIPLIRKLSIIFNIYDRPNDIKTHKGNIPLFGGLGVFFSFYITLLFFRFYTHFPTGTLRDLRYILIGSFFIFLLGFIDDFKKPKGLSVKFKFFSQFLIALLMLIAGFKIKFIHPYYIGYFLTLLWIVGVTNSINIIDIMDGLSSLQVFIAAMSFLFISLPSEHIYVNFLAAALAGSILGFIPYNFSNRFKIFMGDSGSLFCGFILSVLALGTEYSKLNPLGVYAPLLILTVPIYDTLFVSFMRFRKGISPFKGSKDHFALRLEKMGFSRIKIVIITSIFTLFFSFLSFILTRVSVFYGLFIYSVVFFALYLISRFISRINI